MATRVSRPSGSVRIAKTHQTPSHTTLGCQGVEKSKKNPSVLTQQEEIARLPNRVEFSNCSCDFLAYQVDSRLFSQNDHHNHLRRSVRSREPLTLPQNSIRSHRGDVRPEYCPVGSVCRTCSIFRDLCRAIRVNPIILEPNDHHNHLRRSVRSREPLTLPQNSIRSHRGDVRPEYCPVGSVCRTCSIFRDLCRAIRVNPIILEPNDHHNHLRRSVRSREPLTLPQNSIRSHRGDVRPEYCPVGSVCRTCSIFRDLCRAIRVNPIILEPNDHHNHLRRSVRSREPLTLPQNSIRSHRGDVRPEYCPVGDVKHPLGFPEQLSTLREASRVVRTGLFSPGCPVGSASASIRITQVRIQKIFLDHFRLDRPVLWLFRGSCITLDDPRNWLTPATGRGGPHCDIPLF
ncbi:hypothetical protein CRG98_045198 [Punica granatum]|uniref:Uncharacterized protein n=1 Tax=Punica granatum TaxID=22663 RepID=A0A2I0HRQ8_PUNGR|nr:hypothetical protein CRG98_045198 [Punica granatum]